MNPQELHPQHSAFTVVLSYDSYNHRPSVITTGLQLKNRGYFLKLSISTFKCIWYTAGKCLQFSGPRSRVPNCTCACYLVCFESYFSVFYY